MPRTRRPLIALLALVAALLVGYGVRALRADDGPRPAPSVSAPSSPGGTAHN